MAATRKTQQSCIITLVIVFLLACGGDSVDENTAQDSHEPATSSRDLMQPTEMHGMNGIQLHRFMARPFPMMASTSNLLMFGEGNGCRMADMDPTTGMVVDRWSSRFMSGCDGYRAENGEIIYVDNSKIVIYNKLTGTKQVVMTCSPDPNCSKPALAADGSTFAYIEDLTSGGVRVYTRTGTLLAVIPLESPYDRAVFTPDRRLVFSSRTKGLVITDTSIKNPKTFFPAPTPGIEWPAEPAVSPDGQWVFFTRFTSTSAEGIYVVSLDGKIVQQVTDSGHWPTWSPDETKIAFTDQGIFGQIHIGDFLTGTVVSYSAKYWATGPLTWR